MKSENARTMKLGIFVYAFGLNPAGWLYPDAPVDGATSLSHYTNLAEIAERGKLDFMFLADLPASGDGHRELLQRVQISMNRFEPLTILSALAARTKHLGLAATVSTSFSEPYNVARQFASLDHISGGRAGWNVVTSDHPSASLNFGKDGLESHAARYERAQEFVEVVFGLWDSVEGDALVLDRESGIYLNPDKVHHLDHKGKHYSVRGPLNIARTPQGRPIIAQAGGSDAGMDLAAQTADVVFNIAATFEKGHAFRKSLREKMAAYGRSPDQIKVLPGINIIVGETEGEAQQKLNLLVDRMHPQAGKAMLAQFLETDIADIGLDEVFPVERLPASPTGSKSLFEVMAAFVGQGLTLRELIRLYAEKQAGNGVVGTPIQVADFMEEWFTGGAADGFILMLPTLPSSLKDFVDMVVPELQRRGIFRLEYEGSTLRQNLGLAEPANRFAAPDVGNAADQLLTSQGGARLA